MLNDTQRALLGDPAAQERITARGELLPCPFYGSSPIVEDNLVFCGSCGMGYEELDPGMSKERWNTRAPILTPEQVKRLEEME